MNHAREAQQALIGPSRLVRPLRRISLEIICASAWRWRKGFVAVMRMADEHRVLIADSSIETHAELVAEERIRRDPAELSEGGVQQRRIHHAALLITLPIGKEEDAVATDRTATG